MLASLPNGILILALTLAITPVWAQTVSSTDSPDALFQAYQQHLTQFPGSSGTLIQNNQWQIDQKTLVQKMAKLEFSLFLEQNQKPSLLDKMIDPLDRSEFNETLNEVALDESVNYLKQSQSADVAAFIQEFATYRRNRAFAFNIVQSSEFLSSQMPAGYVRGLHMVVVRYNELDRASWLTIFIHELSHYLDQKLTDAVTEAVALQNAHPTITVELVQIAQKVEQKSEISPEEAALVDQWIGLALERGMMAEIRAWTRTYSLYLQLRAENLIGPVEWADTILAQKQASESMEAFCKRYFDALYAHPTDGMWSHPYLKERLEALRAQKLNAL